MEPPKIISVDDHVIEPPHVWQTYLPEKFREKGPRVERGTWGDFRIMPGARYEQEQVEGGQPGDFWVYEDRIIYVHKRFVAIPMEATPGDDPSRFDRTKMVMTAVTYDEMRPGCWQVDARVKDMELNWVDGSLPFPTFPRFCGQTFLEGNDMDLGLACVQAYNDWMIEEWCGTSNGMNIPLTLLPLWDPNLCAAEVQRNAARGARAVCFSEIPTHLGLPSIHTGHWDPLFAACNDTGTTVCMHIGSSSKMPVASPDAPTGVNSVLAFNNSFASLIDWLYSGKLVQFPELKLAYSESQIGWLPYALERADTVWEHHDSWIQAKQRIPNPPSSYYYGRVYGCFTIDDHGVDAIDKAGEDNICFEVDYPHTDTTWPDSRAYIEKLGTKVTPEQLYKIVRGNAIKMLELDRT
ncbi:MAG: amidohydrolase family protein [Acidimicrobiia bacterium]